MNRAVRPWSLPAVLALLAAFCAPLAARAQDDPFAWDVIANFTYQSADLLEGSVTLEDGTFETTGAMGETVSVWLLPEMIATGDLTGDGVDEAVVVLVTNTGGSGNFVELAVLEQGEDGPQHTASAFVGDRVRVDALQIADGALTADLTVQDEDDPMCCPTLPVRAGFAWLDGELRPVTQEELGAEDEAVLGTLNAEAAPTTAALTLDGRLGWADPTLVSVRAGFSSTDDWFDGQTLAPTCTGGLPRTPTVTVEWRADESDALRFFTLGQGDLNLAVVAPGGHVYCADDWNEATLNPLIEVLNPSPGRYAVFVGSYYTDEFVDALLVVTTGATNPAEFDLASVLSAPEPLAAETEADSGAADAEAPAAETPADDAPAQQGRSAPPGAGAPDGGGSVELDADTLPLTLDVAAGGAYTAGELTAHASFCYGSLSEEPSASLVWSGDATAVSIFAEAERDTTLIVRGPDGSFTCTDDAAYPANINPQVTLELSEGTWDVWVGNYLAGESSRAALTISPDPDALPVELAE